MLSGVAYSIRPRDSYVGKTPLVWTSDDNPARREQVALFNKLHSEYILRLDPDNSTMEKVIVQSLGGVGPDLFDCYGAGMLSAFAKSGIAWDITDELVKRGIDVQNDCWSVAAPSAVYDGRVYGFPTNAGHAVIWFNKDIFDRCHVPYPKGPWKWNEFVDVARRLTVRGERGRAKQYGFLGDWGMWPHLVLQWGGHMYNKNGTRCTLDNSEAIAAVQFLHDLVYKYRVMPNPVEEQSLSTRGGWGSGSITLFATGKGAMAFGGRYWLCLMRKMNIPRLGVVECPYERVRAVQGWGRATLINKNSIHREEALDFLIYLAGKDYNELVNHQADGLGPVKKFCYTESYLRDPKFPKEDYNAVWRDTMKRAVPPEDSPFVGGDVATRIVVRQIDLVKSNQKSAAQAMKAAARQVNAEIEKTIARDPSLRKLYDELVEKETR